MCEYVPNSTFVMLFLKLTLEFWNMPFCSVFRDEKKVKIESFAVGMGAF